MKTKLTTLLFLIFISSKLFGQFQINAGNDTTICVSLWGVDTTEIGGSPTVSGGVEPYIYAWSANYTIGSNFFGASYFLDDSTKANPKIVNEGLESLKFKLTVTDANGVQLTDSINVRFSKFAYLLSDCFYNINRGDTVTLYPAIGHGISPLRFSWTPNYNISDTSISNPRVWPDKQTNYQLILTDSIGCISEPQICKIYVDLLGITPTNNIKYQSNIFPNPINDNSVIYLNTRFQHKLNIKIINVKGEIVVLDNFIDNFYKIGNKITKSGFYLYVIFDNSQILSYGQFLKK